MQRLEKRDRMITYCDLCKKEITDHSHTNITYEGKEEQHFCSVYTSEIDKTCYDKHKEQVLKTYKKSINHGS